MNKSQLYHFYATQVTEVLRREKDLSDVLPKQVIPLGADSHLEIIVSSLLRSRIFAYNCRGSCQHTWLRCHSLSNRASFWPFGKSKSRKTLMHRWCFVLVQITHCISVSPALLCTFWRFCGELLCPVLSHCCALVVRQPFSGPVCTSSVVLLTTCKHRLRLCGHVPPATLCGDSETFCNRRRVPNNTSFMSDTTVGNK